MAKKSQKFTKILKDIFGTYTAPEWVSKVKPFIKENQKFKKIFKICMISLGGVVGAGLLTLAGFSLAAFIQSKTPVEMTVAYSCSTPTMEESATEPLSVTFYGSVAKLDDIDKPVTGASISPQVAGEWKWNGDSSIVFVPAEPWKLGTKYTVKFNKDIFAKHVKIDEKNSSSSFETKSFKPYIISSEYVIDDVDPAKKYITCSLYSSLPFMDQDFSSLITIKPEMKNPKNGTFINKEYSCKTTFSDDRKTAYVVSEVVGVPATDVKVVITVKGGIKCALYDGVSKNIETRSVTVPGYENFVKVTDVGSSFVLFDNQEYGQIINISTSAKISMKELNSNLEMYVLPKDRPAEPGIKAEEDKYWYSTEDITDKVLSLSEKLNAEPIDTENEYEQFHSYHVNVPASSFVYVKLKNGTHFYGDYYLTKAYVGIVRFGEYPKELNFVSTGNLISLNGSRKIPIMTRGISEFDIEVVRLKTSEINHIVSQSNGDLKDFRFRNYNFDEKNVGEYVYNKKWTLTSKDPKKINYLDFDFTNYLDTIPSKELKNGLFLISIRNNEYGGVRKLVMVSDQALIIKNSKGQGQDVFVQSISKGTPISNSRINVLGLNGTVLASTTTDRNGHAFIPYINNALNVHPAVITAEDGNDFAFVPYSLNGRYVNYSNFDVGGIYGAADPDKLSAYIFNDRGIYRPGDEIRFGAIIKAGDWTRNLKGAPMNYVIRDPNGNEIFESEFNLGPDGFEEIKYSTKPYSPTGLYTIYLYLKKYRDDNRYFDKIFIGSQTAKVEEFMPDTLQITSVLEPLTENGWIHPQNLKAVVKLKNMFGTNAVGNTVKADMELVPGYIRINKFRDYIFNDPFRGKDSFQERLDDTTTDNDGYARFDIDVERFAPASYRLIFTADGFEKESGRSVTTSSSLYVSPLNYLIGVKADGGLDYIKKNNVRMLKLIAVGPTLETVKVDNVKLVIKENRYVSVLVKQPNGIYKYQSVKKEYDVLEKKISIPKGGMEYALPVDQEGDFVLQLFDEDGNEFNKTEFSVVGEKNVQRSLSRTAEIEVKMPKTDLKKGETAELLIKAPYAGSGLICIERDKVYSYKWFKADESSSVQHITVPQDIEGNGYITVMFKRDYASKEIYMSPFCYAAVPFSVSLDDRKNDINLNVPDVVKPDTDYEIKYSSSKKAKMIIMAIDEGILQVAKYQTPDPLSFFFKKRALEVGSYQTLDLIMPEFNVLKTLAAAGGGGDYDDYLSHNLNPFKKKQNAPVAFWSGIIESDGTERSVKYHIPSYFNGKIRVMAVAVADDCIGVSETSTNVKDTYIIMPNSPNFASPGDEFEVAVTVTNNDAGTGDKAKVKLTAKTDKGLTALGSSSADLTIPEGRDATYTFKFKATDALGNSDIIFTAQGDSKQSKNVTSLSIRPSVPYQVWIESGVVRKGENKKDNINVDVSLYNEFAKREINLSYLPLSFAKGLKFYLDNYPYGCSEQVTSAAFPYLFPELLKEKEQAKSEAKAAVQNVVDIIQSRQQVNGAIGYWTQKSNSYATLDAYCALFLTVAKEKGYYVPQGMFDRLLNALKVHAVEKNNYDAAFAIYVLTRNEVVTTSYLERLAKNVTTGEKMSLTGFYMAASYKLLHMDSEASKIMKNVKKGMARDRTVYAFENNLYYDSSFLFLVSEYFPEQLRIISDDLISSIENEVINQGYNTISSAMTLMALESYLKAVPSEKSRKFTVKENFAKGTDPKEIPLTGESVFSGNFDEKAKSLSVENPELLNLYYQTTLAGFMDKIPASETRDNGLEVTRVYSTSRNGNSMTNFALGDEVYVTVRIRSTRNGSINNIAVVDMLPTGFEADITSIRENSSDWKPDYIDIRDDRVILYGTASKDVKSFTYKAKAITKGSFVVPPLFAQAMYENKVKAVKPYEKIEIKEAK